MKQKTVPTLSLPTSDYQEMLSMSNRRLVSVLRAAVLAPDRARRFSPRPPAEHDAYVVSHEPECIAIRMFADGAEVFCCQFVPTEEY